MVSQAITDIPSVLQHPLGVVLILSHLSFFLKIHDFGICSAFFHLYRPPQSVFSAPSISLMQPLLLHQLRLCLLLVSNRFHFLLFHESKLRIFCHFSIIGHFLGPCAYDLLLFPILQLPLIPLLKESLYLSFSFPIHTRSFFQGYFNSSLFSRLLDVHGSSFLSRIVANEDLLCPLPQKSLLTILLTPPDLCQLVSVSLILEFVAVNRSPVHPRSVFSYL
mmetsp:Transcript_8571/g.21119  ORF Transcript_8571/g.21119 Transcript_8571/m.21119 type:complete len:220 (-) Transcript_8571:291-950(-)